MIRKKKSTVQYVLNNRSFRSDGSFHHDDTRVGWHRAAVQNVLMLNVLCSVRQEANEEHLRWTVDLLHLKQKKQPLKVVLTIYFNR